jgi:hypothetical protein
MSIIDRQFVLVIEIELLEIKLNEGIMHGTMKDVERTAFEQHIKFKEIELQALKTYAHIPIKDMHNWKEYL